MVYSSKQNDAQNITRMSNLTKVLIPTIILVIIYVAYIFAPSDDIGSFDKIRSGGEIKQSVNVELSVSRGFERDANGNITGFYALDKDGAEARINLQKPAPDDLLNARVVELFGHMHGDLFIAADVTVVR